MTTPTPELLREAEELFYRMWIGEIDLTGCALDELAKQGCINRIATSLQRRDDAHRVELQKYAKEQADRYNLLYCKCLNLDADVAQARDAAFEEAAKVCEQEYLHGQTCDVSKSVNAIRTLKSLTVSRTLAADTSASLLTENSTHEPCPTVFSEEATPRVGE